MGQDPYGGGGDFTPYRPGDAPGEPEQGEGTPREVPYGGATDPAPTPAAPATKQVWPWIVVTAVVLGVVGSCFAGIVSVLGSDDSPGSSSSSGGLGANDLSPGQCLVGTGLEPGEESVGALKDVSCTSPHDAEVVAVNPLDADEAAAYDFEDADGAFESCEPYFSDRAKRLLEREDLYLIALTQSATPSVDDQVACLLVHEDGSPLDGPVIDLVPESVMPSPTV
ncbi:hypothetical protein [Nocardioides sp. MH1]|uniref:hypothetical protein n=1 Tax=Nocardioides sp. MH1 TaxID=3242490 RepID=UPI0035205AC4